MSIKRIKDFPEGSGSLSNDDIFIFMDDPSGNSVTKKISLSQISSAIGGGGGGGVSITNSGDNRILTSDGTSTGINGEGNLTFNGTTLLVSGIIDNAALKNYKDVTSSPSIVSSGLTIDLSQGNVFLTTLNSNVSGIDITNVDSTANRSQGFTLVLTMDGTARSVTWPNSIKWPGSGVPVLSSGNLLQDVFSFVTHTNGSSWLGFIGGYEY